MSVFSRAVCSSSLCGWNAINGDVGCSSGNDSCLIAELVTASESNFFTAELKDATDQIQEILANIQPKRGRKLAFLKTPFGILLAWVRHDMRIPVGAVNSESSPQEIKKALGLKHVRTNIGKDA